MENALKIVAFVALIVVAFALIWRGLKIPPDDTNNKARSGGSGSDPGSML
jgi:hypothetical protein